MIGSIDEAFVFQRQDPETALDEYYLSFVDPDLVFERGLPPEAIIGKLVAGPEVLDPDRFIPNGRFIQFLHAVIARYAPECPGLVAEAERQRDGYVYLIDGRTPTPGAEVPTEDIIGAIEVHAGVVGGYEANPNYLVFTVNGLISLDPWFYRKLAEELERIVNEFT